VPVLDGDAEASLVEEALATDAGLVEDALEAETTLVELELEMRLVEEELETTGATTFGGVKVVESRYQLLFGSPRHSPTVTANQVSLKLCRNYCKTYILDLFGKDS
jgi:hypothetical protein